MNLIEIKILHAAVERRINQELSAIHLTFVQAMVIQYLYHHMEETTCQKDIQRALGLTHPTVSSILNRLEEKQLICTEALGEDRRYKTIRPTGQSEELYQKIQEIIARIHVEIFDGISVSEQEKVSDIFQKMLSNLNA